MYSFQTAGGHVQQNSASAPKKGVSDVISKIGSFEMASNPVRGAEGLHLGSITETWKNPKDWNNFKEFLKTVQPEGVDGSGKKLGCER